jgi:hypothetical protein
MQGKDGCKPRKLGYFLINRLAEKGDQEEKLLCKADAPKLCKIEKRTGAQWGRHTTILLSIYTPHLTHFTRVMEDSRLALAEEHAHRSSTISFRARRFPQSFPQASWQKAKQTES